ncbi:MAG: ImmA/IrrE family metallo-endopeptidase [Phycisphaerae bacterium]|nr:ImmA/IrrE family metallo-endopeptidase [Phycisphaerae bacterium]
MQGLNASYLEIEPYELVCFLLKEGGQYGRDAVNPFELLDYLKLDYLAFDFDTALPPEVNPQSGHPRALLSFSDRLVAVDENLAPPKARFSALHEIAHYVLPTHQHSIYLCDRQGMSHRTRLTFEKTANDFAADMLFKGGMFSIDVAAMGISVKTITTLAAKYQASFEATARRLADRSLQPVMLAVFKNTAGAAQVSADASPAWGVRYCIGSPAFKSRFFTQVTGTAPSEVAAELTSSYRDINDSITRTITIDTSSGQPQQFTTEFFYNQYNIFSLLTPKNT